MRRIEALHTAALLVDQHGGIAAERSAEVVDQPPQRLGLGDIARKHDQTPGLRLAQERSFRVGQRWSGNSGNEGAHVGRLARALREGQALSL